MLFSPVGFKGNRFHYWKYIVFFPGRKTKWKCLFRFPGLWKPRKPPEAPLRLALLEATSSRKSGVGGAKSGWLGLLLGLKPCFLLVLRSALFYLQVLHIFGYLLCAGLSCSSLFHKPSGRFLFLQCPADWFLGLKPPEFLLPSRIGQNRCFALPFALARGKWAFVGPGDFTYLQIECDGRGHLLP